MRQINKKELEAIRKSIDNLKSQEAFYKEKNNTDLIIKIKKIISRLESIITKGK